MGAGASAFVDNATDAELEVALEGVAATAAAVVGVPVVDGELVEGHRVGARHGDGFAVEEVARRGSSSGGVAPTQLLPCGICEIDRSDRSDLR